VFKNLLFFNSLVQLRNFFGIKDKITKFSILSRSGERKERGVRSNCLSRVRFRDWHELLTLILLMWRIG